MFIPDTGSELKHFNPKIVSSSRKYDPGCSSRIRILIFYPTPIPDPEVKKALDPGSAILLNSSSGKNPTSPQE